MMDDDKIMKEIENLHKAFFDPKVCENCGGTGAPAIIGCEGLPIDFELECEKCGRELHSYRAT